MQENNGRDGQTIKSVLVCKIAKIAVSACFSSASKLHGSERRLTMQAFFALAQCLVNIIKKLL